MSGGLRFIDELPGSPLTPGRQEKHYDELTDNPGVWAEWWGSNPKSVHTVPHRVRRPGFRFEAAIRDGKGYVRAVPE